MDETEKKFKNKMENYLDNAKPLFENLEICVPENIDIERVSEEFKNMALNYYNDSLHFYENGDYANALGALEYAEGWLDAGKVLGVFKINNKSKQSKF